nr:actin-binding, cofilin/tropomyosin type [Tanacetum cinerariifolium]
MKNVNPFVHVPPSRLHVRITQELNDLRAISTMIDSHLGQPLNDCMNSYNIIEMDDLESDNGSVNTPLVSPFLDSEDESMMAKKFVAYFDPFLPMNIITRKAYNTIMVEGLESMGRNLVTIARDVYVFVGSFTYVTNFVLLEDIGEFIVSNMTDMVMGRSFRAITESEYDWVKGLISFSKIFDIHIFRMPRTIPRLKNFEGSKVLPILVLNQQDMMNEFRVNKRLMQMQKSKVVLVKAVDADLVVMDSSGTESGNQDTSSSSGNYLTHVVDVDIRPVNGQVPFTKVQLTAQHNVLANEQQHTEQSEPIYNTYLLEKVDSNTTPDSTNMSHMRGEIDQDAEQCQAKSPLLNAELFKTKEMIEKEMYNELLHRFLLLENIVFH